MMNNWIFSLLVTLSACGVYAQVIDMERGKMPNPRVSAERSAVQASPDQSKVVIWSSNFNNSQDWTIGNSAGNSADWEISDAPSFWWSSNAPLASSSGGYAASFNSDQYAMAANQTENNAWVESAPFGCSNFNTVAVTFQQFFNKWTGRTFIQVTNNNGQTWVDYEVNAAMENNDETSNPSTAMVDISATAANQQEVKIRFLYLSNAISDGGTDNTAGVAWDYGWIVDDVVVAELPDNDMALIKSWHANIVWDYEYSQLPLTQARPMNPGVVIANQGALQQSFDVTATITDASGIVNTTSEYVTIPYGTIDTVWFSTGYTPTATGEYQVSFSIPQDQDPSDNEIDASPLLVTNHIMAHDYGNAAVFGWDPNSSNPNIVALSNAPHSWGNIYKPETDQQIFGVDINFANGTTPGMQFVVRVQRFDSLGGIQGNLQLVNERLYVAQASDIGNGITTVAFSQPSMLVGGSGYIIDVLKIDGTTTEGFFIGGSDGATEDDDYSAVAYGPYGQNSAINYYVNWGFSPLIRANFNAVLSTEEIATSGFSVYPNPTTGIVNIQNNDNESSLVEVLTLDGKVVDSRMINTSASIDLSTHGAGIYLIKASNTKQSFTTRIVVR
ncbi:MAG: hypothetical protein Crog4KO_27680 [Crocinitomicaceae bacterium]